MTRLGPSIFYRKKHLREDNREDEPILDRTPTMGGGLEESWTRMKAECTVVERQTLVGVEIRKDLF